MLGWKLSANQSRRVAPENSFLFGKAELMDALLDCCVFMCKVFSVVLKVRLFLHICKHLFPTFILYLMSAEWCTSCLRAYCFGVWQYLYTRKMFYNKILSKTHVVRWSNQNLLTNKTIKMGMWLPPCQIWPCSCVKPIMKYIKMDHTKHNDWLCMRCEMKVDSP